MVRQTAVPPQQQDGSCSDVKLLPKAEQRRRWVECLLDGVVNHVGQQQVDDKEGLGKTCQVVEPPEEDDPTKLTTWFLVQQTPIGLREKAEA